MKHVEHIQTKRSRDILNEYIRKAEMTEAELSEQIIRQLIPPNVDDERFIREHDIHFRRYITCNDRELWMDGKKLGTFSGNIELTELGHTQIFRFIPE